MVYTKSQPVIPILHPGVGIIKTLEDMCGSLVRHFMSTPGRSYLNNEKRVPAVRDLISIYEQNPNGLCEQIRINLEQLFQIYNNNNSNIVVECIPEFSYQDNNKYDVVLSVSGIDAENNRTPFFSRWYMEITEDKKFKIKFKEGTTS